MASSLVEAGIAAHSTDSHQDGASPPPSTAELTAAAGTATATATTATAATVRAPPLYTSRLAAEVEAQSLRTSAAVTPVTTSSSAAATAAATAAAAATRNSSTVYAQQQHPARDANSSSGSGSLGVHTGVTADMSRSSSGPVGASSSSSSSSAISSDNPFTMAWGDGWPKRFPALSAYASRAWCRCELFMATSVPMPPDGMCVYTNFI
jgi:hypothetical protein